ncbi:Septum-promoting GTP-binding protein 1 [Camellia lanceoleosa]|uniref:Septum-promoting GTP-binding protein 1 n=1 Tax=Camellia lanceoleosa TaxID=1840588 RepID=A0ACC0GCG9_9ERIC|nr:Septum-promoting GTP-binding protein 1 [Camellia lanceoleosa]
MPLIEGGPLNEVRPLTVADPLTDAEPLTVACLLTSGDNRSLDQIPIACKDAVAILFMFDLTSRCTLNSVIGWYNQARKWNQTAIPILIETKFDDFVQLLPDLQWTIVTQQFAQRSRVRKLQYIAELERNVQALQAFLIYNYKQKELNFIELEFLNQRKSYSTMENKALKQRLESLAQSFNKVLPLFNKNMKTANPIVALLSFRLINIVVEHEVLEREIGRLRALCQQQQQPSSSHRCNNSRDLDSQFANLSLKHGIQLRRVTHFTFEHMM